MSQPAAPDIAPDTDARAAGEAPSVVVSGVNYAFGRGQARKQILFDVDLAVYPRELIILTGPSGAGKTTLLSLIGALRALQDGDISILGTKLAGMPMRQLNGVRRRIGFIFQDHNLFEALTARQTLKVTMKLFPGRYQREDFQTMPVKILAELGMERYLDDKPEKLSTGQKQRIAIARALINRPKLILADEPTASLDAASSDSVMGLLHHATREDGATVIMITHDSRIFHHADHTVEMTDGRITGEI
jgi:putative ABC transport system ATP-binding protein